MRLYGYNLSGNCLKIWWTARHLGKPVEWIETDLLKGEHRTPQFLARNPAGQVPVVEFQDGRTLSQSNAICLYLAEGSELIPEKAFERAQMMQWLFWEQYSHEPAIAVARGNILLRGATVETLDPALVGRCHSVLDLMERELAARPFFVGDRPTLADLSIVAYTRLAPDAGFILANWPAVSRWIARVEASVDLSAP
jgi:glutathione S-transferase